MSDLSDPIFMEAQWKAYMSSYTSWTLHEAYDIYVRPGSGGKAWTPQEKTIFNKIKELSGSTENPFIFRLMPVKNN